MRRRVLTSRPRRCPRHALDLGIPGRSTNSGPWRAGRARRSNQAIIFKMGHHWSRSAVSISTSWPSPRLAIGRSRSSGCRSRRNHALYRSATISSFLKKSSKAAGKNSFGDHPGPEPALHGLYDRLKPIFEVRGSGAIENHSILTAGPRTRVRRRPHRGQGRPDDQRTEPGASHPRLASVGTAGSET